MVRPVLVLLDVNLVHCELHQEVSEGGGQALETSHYKSVKKKTFEFFIHLDSVFHDML